MQPKTLVQEKMKFTDWSRHLSAVEHWIGFSLRKGQEVEDKQFNRCLHATLDDELLSKADNFKDIDTKQQLINLMEEILLQYFPLNIR